MVEDLVTYQIALKLKEKGFDIPCEMYYHIHDDIEDSIMSLESTGGWCDFYNSKNRYRCAAPTIYQTLKWLREEKRIEANGCYDNDEQGWMGYVCEMDIPDLYAFHALKVHHKSYEEATLSAIEYVLNNNLI